MSDENIKSKLDKDAHYYVLDYLDYDESIKHLLGLNYIKYRTDPLSEEITNNIYEKISMYDIYNEFKPIKLYHKQLLKIDPQYIYTINDFYIGEDIFKILREKKYERDINIKEIFGPYILRMIIKNYDSKNENLYNFKCKDLEKFWTKYETYRTNHLHNMYSYIELDKNNYFYASGIACVSYKNKKFEDNNVKMYFDTIEIYKIYFNQYEHRFFKIKKLTYTSNDLIYGYNNIYNDYPTYAYLMGSKQWASAKFVFSYRDANVNDIYVLVKIAEKTQHKNDLDLDDIVPMNSVKISIDEFLKYIFSSMDLYYYNMRNIQMKKSNNVKDNDIELTKKNLYLFGDDYHMKNYFTNIDYEKYMFPLDRSFFVTKIELIMNLCDIKLSSGLFVSKKKSTDSMLTHYHNSETRSKFLKVMQTFEENYNLDNFNPIKTKREYNILRVYSFFIENFNATYIMSQNDLKTFTNDKFKKTIFSKYYDDSLDFNVQSDNKSSVLFVIVINYDDDDYEFKIYAIIKPISSNTLNNESVKEYSINKALENYLCISCRRITDQYVNSFSDIDSKFDFDIYILNNSKNIGTYIKMSTVDQFIKKHFDIKD